MVEFTLTSQYDDLQIAVAMCEPEVGDSNASAGDETSAGGFQPKGIIQIVHGMVEHKERYYPFMEWMASQGFVCIAHDHRGHGGSVKNVATDLGYMYTGGWRALVEDTRMVCDYVKHLYPDLPLTLFGHSMGSMVVRSFVKRYDSMIDELIVCGCPSENPLGGIGRTLARCIGFLRGDHYRSSLMLKMSIGAFRKKFKAEHSKNSWITSDTEVVAGIDKDPLCGFVFTANGYYNLTSLMMDCYDVKGWALGKPELPVHFISGADDPCRVNDEALAKAVESMRLAGYKNVDLKTYPGMRHHLILERDKEKVWNDIKSFAITK